MDNSFRKPRTGLWEKFLLSRKFHTQHIPPIDLTKSFYCGDAAGRPRDHSNSDYTFALNAQIPFKIPEQLFSNFSEKATKTLPVPMHPSSYLKIGHYNLDFLHELSDQNIIVLTGSPASGKTTITNRLKADGYEVISQDHLKTQAKCKKIATQLLKEGNNVVIDNTNPTTAQRKVWIDIASSLKITEIVSIHMTTPKQTTLHMNSYRNIYDNTKDPLKNKVPDVAIHTYYKRLEPPLLAEGFSKLVELSFLLDPSKDNSHVLTYLR